MPANTTLLEDVLTHDATIAETAPNALREVATEQPLHAPEAVQGLKALLATPREDLYDDVGRERDDRTDEFSFDEPADTAADNPDSALTGIGQGTKTIFNNYATSQGHREAAAWALAALAPRTPDLVADAASDVYRLFESDRTSTREYGLYAAARIAAVTPADAEHCVESVLVPALREGTPGERALAAWGVADVAATEPDAALPAVSSLRPLVTGSYRAVRANAAEALLYLAADNASRVGGNDTDLIGAIKAGNHHIPCAWAIARANHGVDPLPMPDRPGHIEAVLDGHGVLESLIDALVTLSKDPEPAVRLAAATALVYVGSCAGSLSDAAMPRLVALVHDGTTEVAELAQMLVQTGPFDPHWREDPPEVDPRAHAATFDATAGLHDHGGENRVYLPSAGADLAIDGFNTYDSTHAVRVVGPGGATLGKMGSPSDRYERCHLNPVLMDRLDVDEGEEITLYPQRLSFAQTVSVRVPADVRFDYHDPIEPATTARLRGQPIMDGDVVPLGVVIDPESMVADGHLRKNKVLPVSIESVTPGQPCLVTEHTQVTVARDEVPDVGDWWGTAESAAGTTVTLGPIDCIDMDEFR